MRKVVKILSILILTIAFIGVTTEFGIMGGIMLVIGIVLLGIGIAIYLIPTFIVCERGHTYRTVIILLNIFLGWTFLGWLGTLIWALIDNNNVSKDKYEDLAKLQKLKESGAITEIEFEIEKQKLLR